MNGRAAKQLRRAAVVVADRTGPAVERDLRRRVRPFAPWQVHRMMGAYRRRVRQAVKRGWLQRPNRRMSVAAFCEGLVLPGAGA